ncbi:MAG: hypothetical protein IRY94_09440 [Rhodospirillaceae bacterium]|nr:hypothetical protein [Rhodospirillaceae bacterium]
MLLAVALPALTCRAATAQEDQLAFCANFEKALNAVNEDAKALGCGFSGPLWEVGPGHAAWCMQWPEVARHRLPIVKASVRYCRRIIEWTGSPPRDCTSDKYRSDFGTQIGAGWYWQCDIDKRKIGATCWVSRRIQFVPLKDRSQREFYIAQEGDRRIMVNFGSSVAPQIILLLPVFTHLDELYESGEFSLSVDGQEVWRGRPTSSRLETAVVPPPIDRVLAAIREGSTARISGMLGDEALTAFEATLDGAAEAIDDALGCFGVKTALAGDPSALIPPSEASPSQ